MHLIALQEFDGKQVDSESRFQLVYVDFKLRKKVSYGRLQIIWERVTRMNREKSELS